jgi:methanogenic corrinoid protein MtbC1
MTLSKNPAFNLKAVLQETGIAADTLRAWERRYGLPMPERTSGGHRLYSQYDIETIKWLLARQSDGLSISRAVDMWNEQTASGADPLAGLPQYSVESSSTMPTNLPAEASLDAIRSNWLMASLTFNETKAEKALNEAFSLYPIESVCVEVLQRGLAEMGDHWYEGRVSVQQEHFASALAMRRLDTLLSASPAPTRPETILVGCPENEWHTFTPLLVSLFLRRRGFNVIYLGANVPADRFAETVKSVRAALVILVAQQLITAATLKDTAQALSAQNIPVAFGGRIFNVHPQIVGRVPGYHLGNSIEESISRAEALSVAHNPKGDTEAIGPEYIVAAHAFGSRRPHIEATLNQSIETLGFSAEAMRTATEFLGDNITAALRLGSLSLVDNEIDWVRNLLKAQHVPANALGSYLKQYAQAVDANINGSGKPIFDWLGKHR